MKCESFFFKTFIHALMFNTSYAISLARSCLLRSREVSLPQLAMASENKQHLKLTLGRLQPLWSLCGPLWCPFWHQGKRGKCQQCHHHQVTVLKPQHPLLTSGIFHFFRANPLERYLNLFLSISSPSRYSFI